MSFSMSLSLTARERDSWIFSASPVLQKYETCWTSCSQDELECFLFVHEGSNLGIYIFKYELYRNIF